MNTSRSLGQAEERLAVLDGLAVLDEDLLDLASDSASISFISFIASTMQSTWPLRDRLADVDVRRRLRLRRAIERADERRADERAFGLGAAGAGGAGVSAIGRGPDSAGAASTAPPPPRRTRT